jgi:hypothetical protein
MGSASGHRGLLQSDDNLRAACCRRRRWSICSATWAATGSSSTSATLAVAAAQYYDYHWAPIGNLGVDLLVIPLGPLLGLEPAVKLIVLLIPPMTVAGFLWVAREVHGRLPPTALFALPFATATRSCSASSISRCRWRSPSSPSGCGCGSAGSAGSAARDPVRADLAHRLLRHTFGWGTLGLLCFSAEAVRQHDRGAAGSAGVKPRSCLGHGAADPVRSLWRSEATAADDRAGSTGS